MEKNIGYFKFVLILLLVFIATSGCQNKTKLYEDEYLIRSGDTVITVGDYIKALEITKTAHPHSILQQPDSYKKIQLRLLSQLAEELVIMKIAEDKNISISDAELKAAVDEIKQDYPDDLFKEVLLENAVTFDLWESRLKQRLLMKKVVASELDSKIEITPENITDYYEEHYKEIESELTSESEGEPENEQEDIYSRLIKRMRMEKKQGAYQKWIDKKKSDYSIEVNEKMWEKITET